MPSVHHRRKTGMNIRRGAAGLSLMALLAFAASCGSNGSDAAPVDAIAPKALKFEGISGDVALDFHILVDQFGYRPGDTKVAVIRNPQFGYDSKDNFEPGTEYQVRKVSDGGVVLSGAPAPWNGGIVQTSSGDRGWWFDFSSVTAPGKYFIYDVQRKVRSPAFAIDAMVYKEILKAAVRMYYYQRSGFAKQAPHAEACWTDELSYLGPNQDLEAHDITDRKNPDKVRNLSGGWFDAGDTNKYVTLAVPAVHQLLTAYQQNPGAFTDDFNIPESGNGIPDIVDEVKWETDWLLRMQYPDGSVALKVGEITNEHASPPSSDKAPRYYIPACTSGTITTAGMLAHASYVYRQFPALFGESEVLKKRAVKAWANYQATPVKQTHCDTGVVRAGNADMTEADQQAAAVAAAIYLFAVTSEPEYNQYVVDHYRELRPYRDIGWSRYNPDQGEALLFYSSLPGVNSKLRETIRADKLSDVNSGNKVYGFEPTDDLYRAFMHPEQYHWGSNAPRANYGNSNLDVLAYGIPASDPSRFKLRALETLHYFHGVNPLGMTYLSNMYGYGASRSANEIYHTWFEADTKWSNARTSACGPPPGYVPGGPNASAERDGVPAKLKPPTGQPPQKSYKDWNKAWPESAWTITEPAIYFQSAYVKLLSGFVEPATPAPPEKTVKPITP